MMRKLRQWFFTALVYVIIGGVIALAVGAAVGASYACHRFYGPWMVGSDPVAVAVFCRGGSR